MFKQCQPVWARVGQFKPWYTSVSQWRPVQQCVKNICIYIRIREYQSEYSYLYLYSPFIVNPNIFVFALFINPNVFIFVFVLHMETKYIGIYINQQILYQITYIAYYGTHMNNFSNFYSFYIQCVCDIYLYSYLYLPITVWILVLIFSLPIFDKPKYICICNCL